jgi:hypothetical protein
MPPAAGDDQHKVIAARKVEERLEGLNGPALLGYGQRQHPGGSAEAHGRARKRDPTSPLRGEVSLATRAREPLKIIDICLRHFGVIGSAVFP